MSAGYWWAAYGAMFARDVATQSGGALAIETHQDGASGVAALLDREGYVAVGTTKDLAGRDRVVEGRTPT